jgi:hypothetical protein
MTLGSSGQPVVNPAVGEARSQRLVLRSLLSALQLPDSQGMTIPSARKTTAKAAAVARWSPVRKPAG